jgi:hypothetical protein
MCEGVDWMYLACDKIQWRTLMNMEVNLEVLLKTGNFLTGRLIE